MTKLQEALLQGSIGYGMFAGLKDPAIVEIAGWCGYDFIIVDTEHSLLDPRTLEQMIRASQASGISCIVRVPLEDSAAILRVLESGADGVLIPHIITVEDMRKAVSAAKYRPVGRRGIDDSTRTARYGAIPLETHIREQNQRVLVAGMIEDVEALEHLEDIVRVPGLDLLFIGMADLMDSINGEDPGRRISAEEAVDRILTAATTTGIPVGMSASNEERVRELAGKGVRWFTTPDVDLLHLSETLTAHLRQVKNAVADSKD